MAIKSPFHSGDVVKLQKRPDTEPNMFNPVHRRLTKPFPSEVCVFSNPYNKAVNTDIPIIHHPEAKFPEEPVTGKEPLAYYKDKPIYDMAEYLKICTGMMIEHILVYIIRTPGKPDIIVDKKDI